MPRGFSGVRRASAEVEAKRGQGGPGAGVLFFKLKSGDETEVRFLEQDDDIAYAMCHEVPVEGRNWGRDVPCLDQDQEGTACPGCEQGLPTRFKGYINLIWFDAPVYKRDSDGKMVKDRTNDPVILDRKPQVALWTSGIRLFEDLDEVNANFKGLRSRRFKVKRQGEGLNTKYRINPVDVDSGPQEFSAQEKELDENKNDLTPFIQPGTYEDFLKAMGQAPASVGHNGNGDSGGASSPRANPFMRNRG